MSDTFGDSLTAAREPGEAVRGGFLTGHAPEVQAEHTANAGQGAYAGPVTGAMSAAAPSAATAGPMQAKRKSAEEKEEDRIRRQRIREDDAAKAQRKAEGAELAQRRRDMGNIELINDGRTWGEEHWGIGKRIKNWWSLKKSTGMSNRRSKVEARMAEDMAWNRAKPSQLKDYEEDEDIQDDDVPFDPDEVYD